MSGFYPAQQGHGDRKCSWRSNGERAREGAGLSEKEEGEKGGEEQKGGREKGFCDLRSYLSICGGLILNLRGRRSGGRGEQLQHTHVSHVYSCGETAEVLERPSKQRMAPRPAWPSPLAGIPVCGLLSEGLINPPACCQALDPPHHHYQEAAL